MEAVVSRIYVVPRQTFSLPGSGRVVGPAGLSYYLGPPSGEDGCYAVFLDGDNVFNAYVYETNQSYDCFCPVAKWAEVGRLLDTRCFGLLVEKEYALGRDETIPFWNFVGGGHYRLMYAMQASPTVVYMRLRAERMPETFYAVYRLYGIGTKDAWWTANSYTYLGVLSADVADAMLDDV